MPTTDPIADLLTRLRNAIKARKVHVDIPYSRMKAEVTRVLFDTNYIYDFAHVDEGVQGYLRVYLRYAPGGESAIRGLRRVSRPGLRRYVSHDDLPRVLNGLGTAILTTSRGIMTGNQARRMGIGGEVIAEIW